MSETQLSPPIPDVAEEVADVIDVHYEFEANGLPFAMDGAIPNTPSRFDITASLPADAWATIQPQIAQHIEENNWFRQRYNNLQQTLHLGEGKVGSAWVGSDTSVDGAPTIHLSRIQTDLRYLPEDSEYYKAKGVGSVVLDALCAIADSKGWRITLFPDERSEGERRTDELIDWYSRRGFKFKYDLDRNDPQREIYPESDMMRLPQTPDIHQPIVQLLNQQKSTIRNG